MNKYIMNDDTDFILLSDIKLLEVQCNFYGASSAFSSEMILRIAISKRTNPTWKAKTGQKTSINPFKHDIEETN